MTSYCNKYNNITNDKPSVVVSSDAKQYRKKSSQEKWRFER